MAKVAREDIRRARRQVPGGVHVDNGWLPHMRQPRGHVPFSAGIERTQDEIVRAVHIDQGEAGSSLGRLPLRRVIRANGPGDTKGLMDPGAFVCGLDQQLAQEIAAEGKTSQRNAAWRHGQLIDKACFREAAGRGLRFVSSPPPISVCADCGSLDCVEHARGAQEKLHAARGKGRRHQQAHERNP